VCVIEPEEEETVLHENTLSCATCSSLFVRTDPVVGVYYTWPGNTAQSLSDVKLINMCVGIMNHTNACMHASTSIVVVVTATLSLTASIRSAGGWWKSRSKETAQHAVLASRFRIRESRNKEKGIYPLANFEKKCLEFILFFCFKQGSL
jgi:hypothetical protein